MTAVCVTRNRDLEYHVGRQCVCVCGGPHVKQKVVGLLSCLSEGCEAQSEGSARKE
ncbi:hypothetical protein EXN66_Car019861 [Channa argus]|uniref:Uncharacterized protein n=1 Tax=Channa argus TaxID=215402 RepID=A0A6G1QPF2_CHAAH|nr:hypothetical protein EXN66_Car019861 [Channa argus]